MGTFLSLPHRPPPRPRGRRRRARAGRGRATVSRPIGPGSTKVRPPTAFLSRRIEASNASRSAGPGTAVGRSERGDHVAVARDGLAVDPLERTCQRTREHEARPPPPRRAAARSRRPISSACASVWPRFSVARSPVRSSGIGRDDVRLHRRARGHQLGEDVGVACDDRGGVARRRARRRASPPGISAYFATSPSPARYSRGGSVASVLDVGEHPERLVERADQVLALGEVDRGLAADGGVDLGEQRGRGLHDRDAAVVHGGGEAGGVADHAATERDDRVVAQQPPRGERASTGRRRWRATWRPRPRRSGTGRSVTPAPLERGGQRGARGSRRRRAGSRPRPGGARRAARPTSASAPLPTTTS